MRRKFLNAMFYTSLFAVTTALSWSVWSGNTGNQASASGSTMMDRGN